jgi:arylsulfatase
MQELFMREAAKYSVLPIDDRGVERLVPEIAGRPDLMAGRTSLTVYEGMIGMSENVFINIKNRSHTITAEVEIPKGGAKGVILAQAGRFGGWSLYLKDGKPIYTYNFVGLKRSTIAAANPVPAGKATIRFEFAYAGGGLGKGGTGTLFVNGKQVARGRIEQTQAMIFSGDEGADVGQDGETPVVETYGIAAPYKFTGSIAKITIDVKEMGKADKAQENRFRTEAAHKKAMSD